MSYFEATGELDFRLNFEEEDSLYNTRTKDQLFGLTVYRYQPIARFLFLEQRKFLFCVYF
jgi:hypothetical protein